MSDERREAAMEAAAKAVDPFLADFVYRGTAATRHAGTCTYRPLRSTI
jgi:hypothetical protein